MAQCSPRDSNEYEHRWIPPEDVRGRNGCHRHCFDLEVSAGLIGIDLQEHVTDAHGRTITVGDDNLDHVHVGHDNGEARPTSSHLSSAPARLNTSRQTETPPSKQSIADLLAARASLGVHCALIGNRKRLPSRCSCSLASLRAGGQQMRLRVESHRITEHRFQSVQ